MTNQNPLQDMTTQATALSTKHHVLALVFEQNEPFWVMNSNGNAWCIAHPYARGMRNSRSGRLQNLILGHTS